METIKLNEIENVLNKGYAMSTPEKPYSILFICESGTGVKPTVNKYINKKEVSYLNLYTTLNSNKEIAFSHYEVGYGNDLNYKASIHNFYNDLLNRKVGDENLDNLKLIITRVYTPLWSGNKPMFGEEDYQLFDKVIFVKTDKEIFKGYFEERITKTINNEKDEKEINKLNEIKKMCLFILNHPKFDFMPIEQGETRSPFGGYETDYFTPHTFMGALILMLEGIDDEFNYEVVADELENGYANITKKAKAMLIEIIKDYYQVK